ncbi:SAUR-like auxin-responsive protein family [Euphorbia peplus]|nr:SAUR-like auxin-responsive protein family [Euphorbia peplus]
MAKLNKKEKNGVIQLMIVAKKLQKKLLMGKKSSSASSSSSASPSSSKGYDYGYDYDECEEEVSVPKDVKEGHFAVIAVESEQPKRFVVPLSYLSNPTFLKLLELAAEEYGFDHQGALPIPCRPYELERILAGEQWA